MTLEELAKWIDGMAEDNDCIARLEQSEQVANSYAYESIRFRAAAAACRELVKYRLVDDESPPHPCPDLGLRADYRKSARERRITTDAALAECDK